MLKTGWARLQEAYPKEVSYLVDIIDGTRPLPKPGPMMPIRVYKVLAKLAAEKDAMPLSEFRRLKGTVYSWLNDQHDRLLPAVALLSVSFLGIEVGIRLFGSPYVGILVSVERSKEST